MCTKWSCKIHENALGNPGIAGAGKKGNDEKEMKYRKINSGSRETSAGNAQRLLSMDVMKVLTFLLIIFYHYFMNLDVHDLFPPVVYSNDNIHIATFAVALFFLLSGFGLMLSSRRKWEGCRVYYKKRIFRILLPFYIVWFFCFIYQFFKMRGWPFDDEIPLWKFIYTVLGVDEFACMHGIENFSMGIGEWFLGCLICMYVLFPVLRQVLERWKHGAFAVISVLWLVLVFWNPFGDLLPHLNFWYKLYEFILGMYLGMIYQQMDRRILAVTVPVIVCILLPFAIPLPSAILITFFAAAVFLTVLVFEARLPRGGKLEGFLKWFTGYSFEIYLVHHVVIYEVTAWFLNHPCDKKEAIILFVCELVLMLLLARAVLVLEEKILAGLEKIEKK